MAPLRRGHLRSPTGNPLVSMAQLPAFVLVFDVVGGHQEVVGACPLEHDQVAEVVEREPPFDALARPLLGRQHVRRIGVVKDALDPCQPFTAPHVRYRVGLDVAPRIREVPEARRTSISRLPTASLTHVPARRRPKLWDGHGGVPRRRLRSEPRRDCSVNPPHLVSVVAASYSADTCGPHTRCGSGLDGYNNQ